MNILDLHGPIAAADKQILIDSIAIMLAIVPWMLGFTGAIYGAIALVCGAILAALASRLASSSPADKRAAHRLFAFSIVYLFVLFAALPIGGASNRNSTILFAPSAWAASPSSHTERPFRAIQAIRGFAFANRDEV